MKSTTRQLDATIGLDLDDKRSQAVRRIAASTAGRTSGDRRANVVTAVAASHYT